MEQSFLQQLELEVDVVPGAFAISDNHSYPARDERLCHKQYNLWSQDYVCLVGLKFERAELQMIRWMCDFSLKDRTSEENCLELSLSQLLSDVVG